MELLWIASIVTVVAAQDMDGRPIVRVLQIDYTTEEDCYAWREMKYSDVPRVTDPASGYRIAAEFYECSPVQPKDIVEDLEEYREMR